MSNKRKPPTDAEAEAARQRELLKEQERRSFIETLAGYGMEPEEIGMLLVPPLTLEQMKANYARELSIGPIKANLETVTGLRGAIKKGNVTAMIYWTKVHMGWSDTKNPKLTAPEAPETAPPTQMPSGASLSERILPFRRK